VQIACAIGVAEPISVFVTTFGTGRIPDDKIMELVKKDFDLRPGMIIKRLDLLRPIYRKTACSGTSGGMSPSSPGRGQTWPIICGSWLD